MMKKIVTMMLVIGMASLFAKICLPTTASAEILYGFTLEMNLMRDTITLGMNGSLQKLNEDLMYMSDKSWGDAMIKVYRLDPVPTSFSEKGCRLSDIAMLGTSHPGDLYGIVDSAEWPYRVTLRIYQTLDKLNEVLKKFESICPFVYQLKLLKLQKKEVELSPRVTPITKRAWQALPLDETGK